MLRQKKVRLNLRKGQADNGWFWDESKSSFEQQSSLLCNFPCWCLSCYDNHFTNELLWEEGKVKVWLSDS